MKKSREIKYKNEVFTDKSMLNKIEKARKASDLKDKANFSKYVTQRKKLAKSFQKKFDSITSKDKKERSRLAFLDLNQKFKLKGSTTKEAIEKNSKKRKKVQEQVLKKLEIDIKVIKVLKTTYNEAITELYKTTMFTKVSKLIEPRKNMDYLPTIAFNDSDDAHTGQYYRLFPPPVEKGHSLHSDQAFVHNYTHSDDDCGSIIFRSIIQLEGTSDHDFGIIRSHPSFFMPFRATVTGELKLRFIIHNMLSGLNTMNYNEFGYSSLNSNTLMIFPKCRIFGPRDSDRDWIRLRGEETIINGSTELEILDNQVRRNFTRNNQRSSHRLPTLGVGDLNWVELGFDILHETFVNDVSIFTSAFEHFFVKLIGLTTE